MTPIHQSAFSNWLEYSTHSTHVQQCASLLVPLQAPSPTRQSLSEVTVTHDPNSQVRVEAAPFLAQESTTYQYWS